MSPALHTPVVQHGAGVILTGCDALHTRAEVCGHHSRGRRYYYVIADSKLTVTAIAPALEGIVVEDHAVVTESD
jgi:hypothetical protein